MDTERLLITSYMGDHPSDAASLLERLPAEEAAAVLAEFPPQAAGDVLRRMSAFGAATAIAAMHSSPAATLLATIPLDESTTLLRRVDNEVREALIAALPEEVREQLRLLVRYPEGTAGAAMDPFVLVVPDDLTVGETLSRIRRRARHVYFYVYVSDRSHRLAGVLDLRELLMADESDILGSVMHADLTKVRADTDMITIQQHPAWREYDALPVVDERGVFVGALRHRAVRRIQAGDGARANSAADTMFSLAELYWIGFGGMIQGLTGPVAEENLAGGRDLD